MQPPPRKGNYAKFLKNLHSEQINKLVLKNQHECDLLEDIRTFTIKRSAIEKSYSEALLKISSAYLNKKIPNIPDIKLEGGEEKWNMWNVWRTVLEENEKLARARLAAVEVFQQQIADDAKILRAHKLAMSKKVTDQLTMVHKELQTCVTELDKTKKFYFDEEHTAHDVRDKARDIEEKLKKKKGSFFQSITSLQKNSAKVTSKREQLEEKSTGARNDYLLGLAAANAHQTRYFVIDLQLGMTAMESGVYDKVAEYLSLMSRTELLTCSAMQNSFTTIRDQARQLTREYNLQCCYLYYPVLKQHIQYEFEPCDNDPIDHVTAEHESANVTLSKEARRWATKIARENNNIREAVRKLQLYNAMREAGQKTDPNDPNGPDLESKIEEQKQNIRRAETAKVKAEARIECLRKGGVNVDEWLKEAESLNVQDIQRSASSLSDHPSSDSFYDSDFAEGEQTSIPAEVKAEKTEYKPDFKADFAEGFKEEEDEVTGGGRDSFSESGEADAVVEQERQRIEQQIAGWDDPTQVDWGAEALTHGTDGYVPEETVPPGGPLLKCTALYSYTAQNPDELTIVENEQLEVVGEGDGDGWLRARNYRGEEGYVPHNYLDIEKEPSATTPGGLQAQISFSSVDYTVDGNSEAETEQPQTETTQSPEQVSVISLPSAQKVHEAPVTYCIALYDYEGEGTEELSFDEGQIIKVLSKIAHSVDDGWWQGEIDGRIGNFPSLVVEECDENGEPLSNPLDYTPPPSAPPVFTPPEIPEALREEFENYENGFDSPPFAEPPSLPPPGPPPGAVPEPEPPASQNHESESPAPSENSHQDVPPPPPQTKNSTSTSSKKPKNFAIALNKNQHEQYGTQFEEDENTNDEAQPLCTSVPPSIPTIGVPTLEFSDEDGKEIDGKTDSDRKGEDENGLGVAQIVITAATPMCEDADRSFPPLEEEDENQTDESPDIEITEVESSIIAESQDSCQGNGCSPIIELKEDFPDVILEEDEEIEVEEIVEEPSEPLTTDNTVSHTALPSSLPNDVDAPKQVVGGRASIPDELEPDQLARLQDLKESNA